MNEEKREIHYLSIALTILGIFYVVFAVLSIFRLVKILREHSFLTVSIVFYLGICISSLTRGSTLYFLSNDYKIDIEIMYLFLVIPDLLNLCVFLVLIWHFLMKYSSSHIQLANDRGIFEGSNKPAITKKIELVLYVVMPLYLVSFIVLSILKYQLVFEKEQFFYIDAGFNIATPVLFVSFLLFLKIKFSGRPYKTKEGQSETKDLLTLTSIWSAERIAIGIFDIILISLKLLENFIVHYKDYTSKILYPILSVLYFLITELVPYYLILDYSTMKTFIRMKNAPLLYEGACATGTLNLFDPNKEASVVTVDITKLKIPFRALTLNQQIYSRKKGLGFVIKGTHKGKDIACREIVFERISIYDQEGIYSDIEAIVKLNNKNICPLIGFCVENDTKIFIVTPYYKLGSLFDYLHTKKAQLPYRDKITLAISIAQGLKYLHDNGIYHCHLSSYNILLEDNMNPLISDYGFDNLKNLTNIFNKYTNKNSYSSPEILQDSRRIGLLNVSSNTNDKIDIISFGFLLWELLTETIPFNVNLAELKEYVLEKNLRPKITGQVEGKIAELIRACWDNEPKNRPGIDEVIMTLQEKLIEIQVHNVF